MVMSKFDTLEPFTIGERLIYSLSLILIQPLLSLIRVFPFLGDTLVGYMSYIAYLMNSFLWALLIWYIIVKILERRRRSALQ